jgi:Ribbon-helix-helix domain
MGKKKMFTMWLHPDQIEALEGVSNKTGIPRSILIRCGVNWTIKKDR